MVLYGTLWLCNNVPGFDDTDNYDWLTMLLSVGKSSSLCRLLSHLIPMSYPRVVARCYATSDALPEGIKFTKKDLKLKLCSPTYLRRER